MSTTTAGIRVWDATEPVSIHGASSAQAGSLNLKIVGKYADVAARDAAYTGVADGDLAGTVCWIINRAGHCYHDGTAWQWQSINRVLMDNKRPSAANSAGTSPVNIILMPDVVLPAGNRLISIRAASQAYNISSPAANVYPRIYVSGTNMSDGDNWAQSYLPASTGFPTTCVNSWLVVASGTCHWHLIGLDASGAGISSFTDSRLQVYDLGPIG